MEDWAEIRRLHTVGGDGDQGDLAEAGISRNAVRRALASEPAGVLAAAEGVGGGRGGAADPGAVAGDPDDAGHGDRRADRVASRSDGAQGPGAGAAAVLPAAGPGLAHRVRPGPSGAVRPVVPASTNSVEVVADLTEVRIIYGGALVRRHQRCWAKHQTITDPVHREIAYPAGPPRHRRQRCAGDWFDYTWAGGGGTSRPIGR